MRITAALLGFFFSLTAIAGLPPTSTKGSGDSNYLTTFQFAFPYIPITHSGVNASFGQIPLGTGVSGNLPVGNLNGGTSASSSTFWRGDGSWVSPAFTNITGTATVAQTTVANQALGTCTTAQTVNWANGNNFTLTLTNASTCALTWSGAVSGQSICIDIYQPTPTGSGAISFATTTLKTATYTMTTGALATDTICIKYNGTDYRLVPQQNFL